MISILVNEKKIHIEKNINVRQLLEKVNSSKNGIAVAVNNHVISNNLWDSHSFSENDTVLIIQASQGG